MSVGGEGIDDSHLRIDQCVRGVDDAQRHLAACHEHHRAAHIVGAHQAVLDLIPDAERDERGARVAAHGDRVGIAGGQASATERADQREARRDLEFDLAVGGCDQYQPVADQIATRWLVDEPARLQVVHPFLIGGDEHIRLAAGFDLARQHRARGERQLDR